MQFQNMQGVASVLVIFKHVAGQKITSFSPTKVDTTFNASNLIPSPS